MKNNLPQMRATRHWSQADLAQRLGVSRQTVNAIETGKFHPSLPLAFKMAHLFRLTIEDIFESGVTQRSSTVQQDPLRQVDSAMASLATPSDDFSWD